MAIEIMEIINAIQATIPLIQKSLFHSRLSISNLQSALSKTLALSERRTASKFLSGYFDKSFGGLCGVTVIYFSTLTKSIEGAGQERNIFLMADTNVLSLLFKLYRNYIGKVNQIHAVIVSFHLSHSNPPCLQLKETFLEWSCL